MRLSFVFSHMHATLDSSFLYDFWALLLLLNRMRQLSRVSGLVVMKCNNKSTMSFEAGIDAN